MQRMPHNTITDRELKESYWLTTHAHAIRTGALRVLIGAVVLMFLWVSLLFGGYLYYAAVRHARIVEPLLKHAATRYPSLALEEPHIVSSGAIDQGTGVFDLYAIIENTQDRWRVDADVVFSMRGVDQAPVHVRLPPHDRTYAVKHAVASTDSPTISARFEQIRWRRLDENERTLLSARSAVTVKDVAILPWGERALTGTQARFLLENRSVYHLYDFRVVIVLLHGTTPVAATFLPVFELKRNQQISLEARWDYAFAATGHEIWVDVDVLDRAHAVPAL